MGYYLADRICPKWSIIVQTIRDFIPKEEIFHDEARIVPRRC